MVNHKLLLRKLELYGFDQETLFWITSYLSNRKQCVSIDGALSQFLNVTIGVPQGSILGPMFYILYTNESLEIVHDHDDNIDNTQGLRSDNLYCDNYGGICCFADDSTYSCSGKTSETIKNKLSENYHKISEYICVAID